MQEKTSQNVHRAFIEESKANQRLLMYARKADEEELPQVAALFRAVAAAEGVHARRHFSLLEAVADTQTNLERAFASENAAKDTHYPSMIKTAEEEGERRAVLVFSQARDVEETHAKLYSRTLDRLIAGDETVPQYYVCPICGYVHDGKPEDRCPVCNAASEKFEAVP